MKTSNLTPTKLRMILIVAMVAITGLGAGAFLYGHDAIASFAREAQTTSTQAQESSMALDRLKNLKTVLAQESDTVTKTDQLVSDSKLYLYQNKTVEDITRYARDAGVSVKNITWSDVKTASTGAAPAATTAPAGGASKTATPANIKSRTATITLASPTDYYKLLKVIHPNEQGLFRMRISTIGISTGTSSSGSSNDVTSDVLTIEVYVR